MKIRPALAILLLLAVSACASREHVASEYSELIEKTKTAGSSKTVIFFLIDGLPIKTLSKEMSAGKLPQISHFFIGDKKQFYIAHTGFPSLTFPGIGSLLTERPVDQNNLFGNLIMKDGKEVDLQSPNRYPLLNRFISGKTIFDRLKAKGLRTVSLDYIFGSGSDVHTDATDFKAGLAIIQKDYEYVDEKTLDSLELLLTKNPPEKWPDFIFVHLVGVDFTSHDHGPQANEVTSYLETLDAEMGITFSILNKAEVSKKRAVTAFLSADHGFDEKVTQVINLDQVVQRVDPNIKMLNEGRFASIYFPSNWSPAQKTSFARGLSSNALIDIVAFREGENVFVQSTALTSSITYSPGQCGLSPYKISINESSSILKVGVNTPVCPDDVDLKSRDLFYPYFLPHLARYFQASSHPDLVVIPKPGTAFSPGNLGQHGGPTPQEIFVPLLIHNGSLTDVNHIPALWELLNFM